MGAFDFLVPGLGFGRRAAKELTGPSDLQKQIMEMLQGGLAGGFEGSDIFKALQTGIGQQKSLAEERTTDVFGRVARSVSGRGMLAPPGQGRGPLGALQVRASVPIQRQLQQNVAGMTSQAQQQFSQQRTQMMQMLLQLDQQIPGMMDLLTGLFQGAGQAAPIFFGKPPKP